MISQIQKKTTFLDEKELVKEKQKLSKMANKKYNYF